MESAWPRRERTAAAESSSDEEEEDDDLGPDVERLQASIFVGYGTGAEAADLGDHFQAGVDRIGSLLVATKSGATACLICLEKVRKTDPVWHCKQGCFAEFHLVCIQSWSRQSITLASRTSRLSGSQFPAALEKACWHCPKCRTDYPQAGVPRQYRCFCGKVVDPPVDPWLAPHSCGERCEQGLGNCGHTCMLLCHPGPCPPCPQLVRLSCHCGEVEELRRCGQKNFSCNKVCNRALPCGHRCQHKCHEGFCPPCAKSGLHSCQCGQVTEVRPCTEVGFQCVKICDRKLSCNRHFCEKRCHRGPCGDCGLQGRRTCPCGKQEYLQLSCEDKVPRCGFTCEKLLHCGRHRCLERCHYGACAGICRVIAKKVCRCGSLIKEIPCYQELICEKRCQNVRNCTRHACKRRCCDGDCPPCHEVCGKKLRCGNHKCPAPCHSGLCAPCPITIKVSCACGYRTIEVPCGADKGVRPPKCSKACSIAPVCGHGSHCKPHRCHYGACPPCQLPCNMERTCGHRCRVKCHGPRAPPKPEYGVKIRKKRDATPVPTLGTPCPPCSELVVKQCVGKHPQGSREVVCSEGTSFSCRRLCGNLLSCGNHRCEKPCHLVAAPRSPLLLAQAADDDDDEEPAAQDSCTACALACHKERSPPCAHACEMGCHLGVCPPCKIRLKKFCHCRTMIKFVDCSVFNALTVDRQSELLSCGGPCHRKLDNCSHLCSETCHPGPCPQICIKKVSVRCACQRLRKQVPCLEVTAKYDNQSLALPPRGAASFVGFLACDDDCFRLQQASKKIAEAESDPAVGVQKEATTAMTTQPRRRRSRRAVETKESSRVKSRVEELLSRFLGWIALAAVLVFMVPSIYYGVKGLVKLSDWMNAMDERRPRWRLYHR